MAIGSAFRTHLRDQAGGNLAHALVTVAVFGGSMDAFPVLPNATIYTDGNLTTPKANPFRADSRGNVEFYGVPGTKYLVSITGAISPGYSFLVEMPSLIGQLLNYQSVGAPITGNTTDLPFYSYLLPGGTVAVGHGLRISISWGHATDLTQAPFEVLNYRIKLGGVDIGGLFLNAGTTGIHTLNMQVMAPGPTTADVPHLYFAAGGTPENTFSTFVSLTGLAWASDQLLTATFKAPATEHVTPGSFVVQLI